MKNAIVTGANGFVGSAVVKALVEQKVKVYAVVRENAKNIECFKDSGLVEIVSCDMSDYNKMQDLIIEKVDVFYHFAWCGSAGPLRSDEKVQLENVAYSCDAVRMAAKLGCKKFVMAGSIMEYEVEALMQTTMPPASTTIYCTAKKSADYMCRAIANEIGIDYICGLISNIYGPGELSPRLVNTCIRRLLKKEHMSLSAGNQMYDFIYVYDAANIFCKLGEFGFANKTYYIGSRNPKPLKEYLHELNSIVDATQSLGIGEVSFQGVTLTYQEFDVNAVYEDTGYELQVDFPEGVKRTMEWIKKEGK